MNVKHFKKKLSDLTQSVHEDHILAPYTTFHIGGPGRFVVSAHTTNQLISLIKLAKLHNIPYVLLGKGANTLIADHGFDGLVILVRNNGLEIDGSLVCVDAGVSLGRLVTRTVSEGLSGIECWAGIPGTVGGSIYGNMGLPHLNRGDIGSFVKTVLVFRDGAIQTLTKKDCGFGYRNSIFKKTGDIILSACLQLRKSRNKQKSVEDMKNFQKKKVKEQPLTLPSSGCIFKNPDGRSVGKMIDDLALKGTRVGGAEISTRHGNFISNVDHATSKDVFDLISLIKRRVKKEFEIDLEEEVQLLGFKETQ